MKFITKTHKKRSAVSPVIATLLLIAIAVAAAIIVYAFVTGLIGGLSSGSSSNLITATASLAVPSGAGPGVLVISVTDNANSPITGIQVAYTGIVDQTTNAITCMGQTTAVAPGAGCGGIAGIQPCGTTTALAAKTVAFCNATPAAINSGVPLPVGSEVSASESVIGTGATALTTGTSYTMSVTVDFANGSTHTQVLTATAQI